MELFYQGYGSCASEIFCSLVRLVEKYEDATNFMPIDIDIILDIVRLYSRNDGKELIESGILLVLEYLMGKMPYSEVEIILAVKLEFMNDSISILRTEAKEQYIKFVANIVLEQFDFAINNEYTIKILDLIYSILDPLCEFDQHLALLLFNKYAFRAKGLGVPVNDKVLEILILYDDEIDDDVEQKREILDGIGFSYQFEKE